MVFSPFAPTAFKYPSGGGNVQPPRSNCGWLDRNEDIEFLWSQPQFATVQGHGSLVKIDPEITEFDPLCPRSTLLGRSLWGTLPQVLVIICRKLQLLVI
jgi:hypothetical protein